jgi:hypothetical protein
MKIVLSEQQYRKLIQEQHGEVLYHGTNEPHQFARSGMGWYNGSFFSTSYNEASSYGDYIYKVSLKPNLSLLDLTKYEDCKLVINTFGELYDNYYEDEDEQIIDDPKVLCNHSDSWEPLEYTQGFMEWVRRNYDGVWLTEGGVVNLLLFSPVTEKIENISLVE